MPLTRINLWSVLLAVSLWHGCQRAVAAEADAARLFHEGRALLLAGRFAEACPQLEQSQLLEPRLGTQLNIAFCHERLGKLATAWRGFREAATRARRERDVTRERFATERADALEPRVPWLKVRAASLAGVQHATLLLDGAPLEPSRWDEELPLDPGAHALSAEHRGEEYWQATVVLRESEHVAVAVPAAPAAAAANASDVAAAAQVRSASRFVYEVGAFIGFLAVDTRQSTPDDGAGSIQAVVQDQDGLRQRLSCATVLCEYPSIGASAGWVGGVSGFVGYALAAPGALGLRFLIGPRAGGGALVAFGPSVSLLLSERFRLGPAALFGTASHVEHDIVQLPTAGGFNSVSGRMHATLGLSMGVGAELGWTVTSSPSGSLVLQATPLYLYGSNGNAWSLPLGAAYHWH